MALRTIKELKNLTGIAYRKSFEDHDELMRLFEDYADTMNAVGGIPVDTVEEILNSLTPASDKTIVELRSAMQSGTLQTGKWYRITDYRAVHPDQGFAHSDPWAFRKGSVKPILVQAVNSAEINLFARDPEFEYDLLHFDPWVDQIGNRDQGAFYDNFGGAATFDPVERSLTLTDQFYFGSGLSISIIQNTDSWDLVIDHLVKSYVPNLYRIIGNKLYILDPEFDFTVADVIFVNTDTGLDANGTRLPGRITRRTDQAFGNSFPWDWRHIAFKRFAKTAGGSITDTDTLWPTGTSDIVTIDPGTVEFYGISAPGGNAENFLNNYAEDGVDNIAVYPGFSRFAFNHFGEGTKDLTIKTDLAYSSFRFTQNTVLSGLNENIRIAESCLESYLGNSSNTQITTQYGSILKSVTDTTLGTVDALTMEAGGSMASCRFENINNLSVQAALNKCYGQFWQNSTLQATMVRCEIGYMENATVTGSPSNFFADSVTTNLIGFNGHNKRWVQDPLNNFHPVGDLTGNDFEVNTTSFALSRPYRINMLSITATGTGGTTTLPAASGLPDGFTVEIHLVASGGDNHTQSFAVLGNFISPSGQATPPNIGPYNCGSVIRFVVRGGKWAFFPIVTA